MINPLFPVSRYIIGAFPSTTGLEQNKTPSGNMFPVPERELEPVTLSLTQSGVHYD